MRLTKDYLIDNANDARKCMSKSTIGIILLSIVIIMGTVLAGCAVVPTSQGRGMAASGEIVLDVDKEEAGESSTVQDKDVKAEKETESKEDKEKALEDESPRDHTEDSSKAKDTKDSEEKDIEASKDAEDHSFYDASHEETQVKSVYNSMVPPYMLPSSEELEGKKIVYLTFDDGPTKNITPQVLDILKEYDVKATFFVIGSLAEENSDLIKRTVEEGHAIANHSYSHDYKKIYANTESCIAEIKKTDDVLSNILGNDYRPKYVRLPGGGFGSEYDAIKTALIKEGYHYITWNAVTNDAVERQASPEKLFTNFKETLNGNNYSVVLMHDAAAQKATPESLRLIIEYLKKEGYEFRTFDN